jgi:hypothetical protein
MNLLIPKERFRSKPALKIDHANDYAHLEAENARLKEALREMMEATEAVDEWKSGEAPSFLGGYAFDLVKAARTKAREVLGDA